MVPVAAFFSIFSTALTFLEGVIEQVAPVVTKYFQYKMNTKKPAVDPNCDLPHCGTPPFVCRKETLSQACIQRTMATDNRELVRLTTMSLRTLDDDHEDKEKAMTPTGTIMLVFVLVIVLAVIAFVIIRMRQRTSHNELNYDGRKSSIGSV